MIIFFDTSALIKNYIEETGSEIVKQCIHQSTSVIVSSTTKIECFSVISRMMSNNEMTDEEANYLHQQIVTDFLSFEVIPLNETLENIALEIVKKYQLRTLDAIQLASALNAHHIQHFYASDTKLKIGAAAEGFSVIDPNETQS